MAAAAAARVSGTWGGELRPAVRGLHGAGVRSVLDVKLATAAAAFVLIENLFVQSVSLGTAVRTAKDDVLEVVEGSERRSVKVLDFFPELPDQWGERPWWPRAWRARGHDEASRRGRSSQQPTLQS